MGRAVQKQAATLAHCSNLYGIPPNETGRSTHRAHRPRKHPFLQQRRRSQRSLIKLARLHGRQQSNDEEGRRYQIRLCQQCLPWTHLWRHGCHTTGKIQSGFRPMLEGFRFGQLNDIESFERLIDDSVAAVFIETIQGEGGIFPAESGFLRELRALCDERGVLLILDEVQCGIGRTGHFFAYEAAGIRPDAVGMAKGLGGGFPIGAIWVAEPYADLFNPDRMAPPLAATLACAAANAVLDVIEENLLTQIQSQSAIWHEALRALAEKHSTHIAGMRSVGYMVGLQLHADCRAVAHAAVKKAAHRTGRAQHRAPSAAPHHNRRRTP